MKIRMVVMMMPVKITMIKVTRPRHYWMAVDEERSGQWDSKID